MPVDHQGPPDDALEPNGARAQGEKAGPGDRRESWDQINSNRHLAGYVLDSATRTKHFLLIYSIVALSVLLVVGGIVAVVALVPVPDVERVLWGLAGLASTTGAALAVRRLVRRRQPTDSGISDLDPPK